MAQEQDEANKLKIGDKMPEFVLQSDHYGQVKSQDFQGEVVLMVFFATWCGPCQQELGAIETTLWPKLKDRKGFHLLVVGREHDDAALQSYREQKQFTFPIYPDPKREVYAQFADSTIPRVYLFDKQGKLIHTSKGYERGDMEQLIQLIESKL